MVSGEESISYKRPGVGSSQICNYDIPNNREGRYFNTPSDGQHGSPVVIIENAGDKESTISQKKETMSESTWETGRESTQTGDSSKFKLNPEIFEKVYLAR